jgi:NAD(P)-dependent dehydrogenase (short-subunit alcohol dehydrogenase family)
MKTGGKSVLITGCSSGIGRACAIFLAEKGFTVFATVRNETGAADLKKEGIENLVPMHPFDLTIPGHLPRLAEAVTGEIEKRGQEGLYAIVNNAGGGFISPIELMDLDKFRNELETRLTGPIALLQAFLPQVRKARGRIVWIATPGLIPLPFDSSIHACDFAVNNLARTLNIELIPWKIPVIMVRCGAMKTEGVGRTYRDLETGFKAWPVEKSGLYSKKLEEEVKKWKILDEKRSDPSEAAKMVFRALASEKPKSRYRTGYMSGAAAFLELLPQTFADFILKRRAG